jgi:hypothetical protein
VKKARDIGFRHLYGPSAGSKHECMRRACLCSVFTKFDGLFCRLSSRSGDDKDVFEPILIESVPSQTDCSLSLIVQQQLCFTIAALHQNASDTSLYDVRDCEPINLMMIARVATTLASLRTCFWIDSSSSSSF